MVKFLERAEEIFCAAALLLTTLILFINVALRYGFSASTSWAEELIRYLMIWITFIGGGVCVRRGAHIRMDFLLSALPARWRTRLTRLVYGLSAAFCAALAWYGVRLVGFTLAHEQISPALELPMWIPYSAMPVGLTLMALHFLQKAVSAE
ncbi:MAG: TRAP transporter small permease [Synergistaceae bacterium]|nr:TRAP transporter small permease [Synergistaceae bacterium]